MDLILLSLEVTVASRNGVSHVKISKTYLSIAMDHSSSMDVINIQLFRTTCTAI